jgi:hypothetical protein
MSMAPVSLPNPSNASRIMAKKEGLRNPEGAPASGHATSMVSNPDRSGDPLRKHLSRRPGNTFGETAGDEKPERPLDS